jgi:hypothetical protein
MIDTSNVLSTTGVAAMQMAIVSETKAVIFDKVRNILTMSHFYLIV